MLIDLVPIWTLILGLAVFYYVVFDGFDLGVGILSGFVSPEWRRLMMNSVAPVWDGNETWLVLGSIGLLAAFPLAFAIIIPAVYFPIVIMLLALVFRGVAFEFRFKGRALQEFWGKAFCVGSAVATFAQGVVLGAFIQGFKVEGRHFVGTSFDFVTPFALLTGLALMFGYALARRRLAHPEDRGRPAGLEPPRRPHLPRRRRHCRGRGEHLDPARRSRHRAALVLLAQHPLAFAGAGGDRRDLGAVLAIRSAAAARRCRS